MQARAENGMPSPSLWPLPVLTAPRYGMTHVIVRKLFPEASAGPGVAVGDLIDCTFGCSYYDFALAGVRSIIEYTPSDIERSLAVDPDFLPSLTGYTAAQLTQMAPHDSVVHERIWLLEVEVFDRFAYKAVAENHPEATVLDHSPENNPLLQEAVAAARRRIAGWS